MTTDNTAKYPVDRRQRNGTAAAVLAGILWACVQLFQDLLIAGMEDNTSFTCSLDQPKVAFHATTVGVCTAALVALGLGVAGRRRAALVTVGVEAILALIWIALGGFSAADCALDI